MGGIEITGSIGPTFFVVLAALLVGLYVAAKYRTNEALKGAVDGWRENAEAQESRADRLEGELVDVRLKLSTLQGELQSLQREAPDLKALYQLNNLAATVNKNNETTLKTIVTQLERLVHGIDTFAQHAAKSST